MRKNRKALLYDRSVGLLVCLAVTGVFMLESVYKNRSCVEKVCMMDLLAQSPGANPTYGLV